MACDNCNGLEGFWCPACQPPTGIDTRDIHARAPIDRIKALEAELDGYKAASQEAQELLAEHAAENARLRAELDAANARIAKVRELATAWNGRSHFASQVAARVLAILNGKEVERGD